MCICGNDPSHSVCSECPPGPTGAPGQSIGIVVTQEPPGINLANGGWKVEVGIDADLDGGIDTLLYTFYVSDGAPGADGATPTLVAGTVTTLPAGSSATATITATGTPNQYAINLGIPQGIQGPAGPNQLLWGRTAFVDDLNGVNGTAVVGDATKPYKTIQAANDALVASGFINSGLRGLIYVRNGSYSTTSGTIIDQWVDLYLDSATMICTNVSNPTLTLLGRSHVIGFAASIAHSVTGGKALYAAFYSGRIFLNKVQGAIDLNYGGTSGEINIRDILPTSTVNAPNGFGDLASGNITITNGTVEFTSTNCWSSILVTDTGTGSVVTLHGNFKNGVYVTQNSRVEANNCTISRQTTTLVASVILLDLNAAFQSFATKIKGISVALKCITLATAANRAYLNSTVLVSSGAQPVIVGDPASAFYNFGGSSGNVAPAGPLEPIAGTQPLYINAAIV